MDLFERYQAILQESQDGRQAIMIHQNDKDPEDRPATHLPHAHHTDASDTAQSSR